MYGCMYIGQNALMTLKLLQISNFGSLTITWAILALQLEKKKCIVGCLSVYLNRYVEHK